MSGQPNLQSQSYHCKAFHEVCMFFQLNAANYCFFSLCSPAAESSYSRSIGKAQADFRRLHKRMSSLLHLPDWCWTQSHTQSCSAASPRCHWHRRDLILPKSACLWTENMHGIYHLRVPVSMVWRRKFQTEDAPYRITILWIAEKIITQQQCIWQFCNQPWSEINNITVAVLN